MMETFGISASTIFCEFFVREGLCDRQRARQLASRLDRELGEQERIETEDGASFVRSRGRLASRLDAKAKLLAAVLATPTKLARAYADADYFARNVRTIDVLIDQDAILSGTAAAGQPWRLYDLGHGYCSYQFFEQCPHRMACAKCSFYVVKGSSRAQLVEGKANLQRMLQEIPLTDGERDAVEDSLTAFGSLLEKLADVPTPAGPTPRQLGQQPTP